MTGTGPGEGFRSVESVELCRTGRCLKRDEPPRRAELDREEGGAGWVHSCGIQGSQGAGGGGFESLQFVRGGRQWVRSDRNAEVRGRRAAGASGFVPSYYEELGGSVALF